MRYDPDSYVTVHERIEKFYAKWPQGRILTSVAEHDREAGFVLMRAEVYREPDDALPAATGHAYELQSAGHVQQGSYVEVGETSAVGRALALLGFEVKRGIASREEMQKASRQAPKQIATAPNGPPDVRPIAPVDDPQLVQDSYDILEAADKLGYDGPKVKRWVNQKYGVTGGLNDLTPHDRKEVLEIFRAQANPKQGGETPRNPSTAQSLADLVTPKQLGMIRALARERELDPDAECGEVRGCKIEELSKRAASEFIDHLKEIEPVAS